MLSVVIGFAACQSKNVELKPTAMLSVELSAKPMLNYARCAMLNVVIGCAACHSKNVEC